MFRHDYPYSDFHELNLDWFLYTFKGLLAEWEAMGIKFSDLDAAVKALKAYVMNYFDNLDVQDEINNKIDELVESGQLDDIIETTINKIKSVDGQNIAINNFAKYRLTGDFLQVQGCCIDNNNNIIYALIPTESNSYGETEAVWYKKSLSTFETIRTTTLNTYHTNSMTYVPDNDTILAVKAPWRDSDGTQYTDNVLFVIDNETFAITNTINVVDIGGLDVTFHAVAYDKETGKTYIKSGVTDIYELDMNTGVATPKFTLNLPKPIPVNSQDMCIIDGLFYFLFHATNTVYVTTMQGDIVKIYTIPYYIGDYMYTGECESLDVDSDGTIWITSFSYEYSDHASSSLMFNRINVKTNQYNGAYESWAGVTQATSTTFYVDCNSTNAFENGTQEYPFKAIQSIADMVRTQNKYKALIFEVAAGDYGYLNLNGILGSIQIHGNGTVRIDGVNAFGCAYVHLRNLTITKGIQTSAVRCEGSKVVLESCSINADSEQIACILGRFSDISLVTVNCTGASYGIDAYASNIYGTITYSENPTNRIILRTLAGWYPGNAQDSIHHTLSTLDFSETTNRSFMFPSARIMYDPENAVRSGSFTIGNITKVNTLIIRLILNGNYYEKHILLSFTPNTPVSLSVTAVTETGILVSEIIGSVNVNTGLFTINSCKTFDGESVTEYASGSDLTKFLGIVSIYGAQV